VSELVRFKSEGGEELLVEIDEHQFGTERVARDARGVVEAADTLDSALERATPALRRIAASLRDLAPDEHEVEFGLKLNAEAGAIVAKTSAEGHFTVKMTWRRRGEP
jgi:hypothetical protein